MKVNFKIFVNEFPKVKSTPDLAHKTPYAIIRKKKKSVIVTYVFLAKCFSSIKIYLSYKHHARSGFDQNHKER